MDNVYKYITIAIVSCIIAILSAGALVIYSGVANLGMDNPTVAILSSIALFLALFVVFRSVSKIGGWIMSLGVLGGLFGLIAGVFVMGAMNDQIRSFMMMMGGPMLGIPRMAIIIFSIIGFIGAATINRNVKLGCSLMLVSGVMIPLVFGPLGLPSSICLLSAGVLGLRSANTNET